MLLTTTKKKKRTDRENRVPTLEQLEKRELFVVGANFFPVAEPNFDGVIQITSPGNSCTGSLLSTGRHILTAAHCVDQDVDSNGNGINDMGDGTLDNRIYGIRFDLDGGRTIQFNGITTAAIDVPAAWNGNWRDWQANGGNDIAIITLPELAPVGNQGADAYDIYRNNNEVTQNFTVVGYGRTGTGSTVFDGSPTGNRAGHMTGTGGTRRSGPNRFDSASAGRVLRLDLDNVAGEVITAPGDSGGPSFLNGDIAGVTSYGNLRSQGNYGGAGQAANAFGVTAGYTRVSQYAAFVDGVLDDPYDLVIDMTNQVPGNDGGSDTIVTKRNGANLELLVNGEVFHSGAAANIQSVTIRGSNDSETIILDTQMPGAILGRGGNDTLAGPNQFNRWRITGSNSGTLNNVTSFSSMENLKGGSGRDNFVFNRSSMARVTGTIVGGGGSDWLDYSRRSTGVNVNLQARTATSTGSVVGVENVKGGSGNDVLIGDSHNNQLWGLAGNDTLCGGAGNDRLYGGAGRDRLYGEGGHDRLYGGPGNDMLKGGSGNDFLSGGSGRDRLRR